MKKLLVVIGVVLTFMAVSIMSGWAQAPMDDATYKNNFFVGSDQGAKKEPIDLGKANYTPFAAGGSEGSTRPGINMGEANYTPFAAGGSEGSTRPGIQWPQPK